MVKKRYQVQYLINEGLTEPKWIDAYDWDELNDAEGNKYRLEEHLNYKARILDNGPSREEQ